MKIFRNRWFPFGKYFAINLFGVVFAKGKLNRVERNHEYIHTLQQRELLFVGFYVLYGIEWFIRLVANHNMHKAYLNISFEREAYANQHRFDYKESRPLFAWFSYIKKG